jgi:ribonucleoside-diphosphate reductase alpha chain
VKGDTRTEILYLNEVEKYAGNALRIMDNIVDLEIEKINQILQKILESNEVTSKTEFDLWIKVRNAAQMGRRTGVGFTGLADTLAWLGYTYGTKPATDFAESIQKAITKGVYKSSVELAVTRDTFPAFDANKELNHPFLRRVQELVGKKELPRRNISMLTIAPTGSVSLLTETSSGVEPVYNLFTERKRKVDKDTQVEGEVYTDITGDKFTKHLIVHKPFLDYLIAMGDLEVGAELDMKQLRDLVELTPYHNAETECIDPREKVRMMGKLQQWIDHSISNTTNLPNDVTVEEVGQFYLSAWANDLKGLTVYRDGCREGVLTSAEKGSKFNLNTEQGWVKRPTTLKAVSHSVVVRGVPMRVFVGLSNEQPYEVFVVPSNDPVTREGYITKAGKRKYFFTGKGSEERIPLYGGDTSSEIEKTTLYISALLRHGMGIQYIADIAERVDAGVSSLTQGVIRVLKGYLPDSISKCPECGLDTLTRRGGCTECTNCGYSKC